MPFLSFLLKTIDKLLAGLAEDTLCQKVYKVKMATDLRRYTAPDRGSKAWKNIYKQRSAVERVIVYLKEFFQLNSAISCRKKKSNVLFLFIRVENKRTE